MKRIRATEKKNLVLKLDFKACPKFWTGFQCG